MEGVQELGGNVEVMWKVIQVIEAKRGWVKKNANAGMAYYTAQY